MRRFAFVAVVELTGLIGLPMVRAVSQEAPPAPAAPAQQEVAPPQEPAPPSPVPGGAVSAGSELLLHLDLLDRHLLLSQQELDIEMSSYRSAVDELKVLLGRPPGAAVVLDEHILEPFRKAFRTIDAWQHNHRRQLGTLGKLQNRLPRLNEVTIGGRSVAQVAGGKIAEAEFLLACTEAADKNRGIRKDEPAAREGRDALGLRIRKLARSLVLTHRNYEIERRGLELAVREVDQRFEQIVSPPAGGPAALALAANVSLQTTGVLEAQRGLYRGQAELVAQWLQFKAQSLELYRELDTMPYDHWEAFQRSFVPDSGGQEETP